MTGVLSALMAHGSMRQRGKDSWELRVYQGIDSTTRRQRWLTRTVHGSKRFARRQLEDLAAEAGRGRIRDGTLSDLFEQWFEAASPGWAAPTVAHTRSIIDCHLKPHLGHLYVAKLKTEDIDDFYGYLLRAGGRNGGPLAPSTITRIHGVLHRALAQAVRWEWLWYNPASNATPPRAGPAEIRPPTPHQVARLLHAVREIDPPLHCYLRLAVSTGARRSQLLALRWGDVDEERAALAFTRAFVQGPDGPTLTWTKTHRTYRVELDCDTFDVVMTHRARAEGMRCGRRRGTHRRRIPVQSPSRRLGTVETQLGDQAVRRRTPRHGAPTLPAARPSPFHGHPDARGRDPHRHRLPAAQPCPRLHYPQRLRALRSRR